jgi:hypothetical protein
MSVVDVPPAATRGRAEAVERPPFVAATIWAWVGAAFVVLVAYVMIRWVTGPYFRPVPAGANVPPTWMKISAHAIEAISLSVFAGTLWHYVIRPWRRDGEISHDGLMVLALITLYWQNNLPNYLSYTTLMNSSFVNVGSWYQYIPGWTSPNMNRLPEAPLAWGLCYACWFVFFPMKLGARFMHWFGGRHPAFSAIRVFAVAYAAFMVLDLVLEGIFLRTGMYNYASTIRSLTLWPGKRYQFPVYEILTWGLAWTVYATFYAYRDDTGMTLVERGVEKLRVGRKRKKLVRFLALVAIFNLVFLAQNAIMILASTHGDPWPKGFKSYQVNGICGPRSAYACPGPKVLIPKQTTPTNRVS